MTKKRALSRYVNYTCFFLSARALFLRAHQLEESRKRLVGKSIFPFTLNQHYEKSSHFNRVFVAGRVCDVRKKLLIKGEIFVVRANCENY
jgi:hypothetical protein